jgi:hypothetical protein|tara:strand:+ start:161 stop:364 length:204 start_codon:yes stop_codon:yes gene_type:complete
MMGCNKCVKISGLIFLVLGILYLGQDLDWWSFWTISWWTALFLVAGIGHYASSGCPQCQVVRTGKKK